MSEPRAKVSGVPIRQWVDRSDHLVKVGTQRYFDAFDAVVYERAKFSVELVEFHDVRKGRSHNKPVRTLSVMQLAIRIPVTTEPVVTDAGQPLGRKRRFDLHAALTKSTKVLCTRRVRL